MDHSFAANALFADPIAAADRRRIRSAMEALNGRPLQDDIDARFLDIVGKIDRGFAQSPAVLFGASLLADGAPSPANRRDRRCDACVRGDGVVAHDC